METADNNESTHDFTAEVPQTIRSDISRNESGQSSRGDFGNRSRLKETLPGIGLWVWIQSLAHDIRYGWRTLRSNLLFTSVAALSLTLGIGANTAIYSIMDAIMLRALPVKNASELVILNWRANQEPGIVHDLTGDIYHTPSGGVESPNFPWQVYKLFLNHNSSFSTLFAYKGAGGLNLVVNGQAEVGAVELVSGNFFSGLGIIPSAGRLLTDSDDRGSRVAVISYDYWRQRFNRNSAALGQVITINNLPFIIVGVAASKFFGVAPGLAPLVYIPIFNRPALSNSAENDMFIDPHNYWVEIMGRLRPGVTMARAQVEFSGLFGQYVLASANHKRERANPPVLWLEEGGSGVDSLRREFSQPLFVLMAMAALIVAIACANIANLLLSRSAARRREIAVRLSLGASRLRVLRQLLTESLMLSLPAGILSLGVAAIGIRFLLWLLSGNRDSMSLRAGIDWRIQTFTLCIALATGIAFGLVPAIQATRVDITPALKEAHASAPQRRGRPVGLGQLLVVCQISLSMLLVLGAALFTRTLSNLHSVEIGFNPEHLLTYHLNAEQAGYKDAQLRTLLALLLENFRALPGVLAATMSDMPLVANQYNSFGLRLPGVPKTTRLGTSTLLVGPAFFETMKLPITLGRSINEHDVFNAPLAAVVNLTFAKKYFPNQNPIGRQFGINSDIANITVVGVAQDARYSSLKNRIPPVAYLSYFQNARKGTPGGAYFELRTAIDPLALAEAVRQTVHRVAPQVPVTNMLTEVQVINSTISQERIFADLCSAFGVLALGIAGVGLYGTMAYMVSRRTKEIGIRMALGAEGRRVIVMVMSEVMVLSAAGLAIGLIAAALTQFTIRSFLFGIKATDPLTILSAVGILVSTLLLAGYAPARRASRIEPLSVLRHE